MHGFGYAFAEHATVVGSVTRVFNRAPARFRLVGSGRDVRLTQGDNLIGRDVDADICIDAPRVSRRHACVHVDGARVYLEDLDSKNGTYVNGSRAEGRVELASGAEIRIGAFVLTLSADTETAPTETETS